MIGLIEAVSFMLASLPTTPTPTPAAPEPPTQEAITKAYRNYFECFTSKAVQLDDNVSDPAVIGRAAVQACRAEAEKMDDVVGSSDEDRQRNRANTRDEDNFATGAVLVHREKQQKRPD